MGIICGRKVLQISFFAIAHEKAFVIQAISYIKILLRMSPGMVGACSYAWAPIGA